MALRRRGDALGAPGQGFTLDGKGRTISLSLRMTDRRRTPPLFGVGQLEAIATDHLRARSAPFDADSDGISGRLPWRDDCFGRFGWQSSVCDIPSFVEGALSRELGIDTFPRSRRKMSEEDVQDLVAFVRGLPPLPSTTSQDGADLFERAQCSACHLPVTGTARIDDGRILVKA